MYCLACGHHRDRHDVVWLQVKCKGEDEKCGCDSFQVDLKDTAGIQAHIEYVTAQYRDKIR